MDDFNPYKSTRQQIVDYFKSRPPATTEDGKRRSSKEANKAWKIHEAREQLSRVFFIFQTLFIEASFPHRKDRQWPSVKGFEKTFESLFPAVNINIRIATQICKTNHWPPYTILIKGESGRVGQGFFGDFGTQDSSLHNEQMLEQQCFSRQPPTFLEVIAALLSFEAKRKNI